MTTARCPLERPKHTQNVATWWTACAPFVENSRAVLIHRPRTVAIYNMHKLPHMAVHYWCNNGSTGRKNFTFLAQCPEEKLLCAKCEAAAVLAGLPSAYELCGRHVHQGKYVAVQTCCQEPDHE